MEEATARAAILVRAAPAAVFDAFVDGHAMSQFWSTRDDVLAAGTASTWRLGDDPTAFAFDVRVHTVERPNRIVIEWPGADGEWTTVTWSFSAHATGTHVTIVETGFHGDAAAIAAQARDSTGGFNQVIVAAKAWVEHGIALNVVADHAPGA